MYAILRTAKLKTAGNCGGLNNHLERKMEVPNADKDLTYLNHRRVGSGDLAADVSTRIKGAGIDKPRKNAVLAIEHLMAASPEAFQLKKGLDPQTGKMTLTGPTADIERWQAFKKNCYKWLNDQYGKENIVNFTTHLDEQTPHIHAVVVPIDKKGKLNCREYLGGREKMRGLQDSFAQVHQELGLERGIKGSKANHGTVKQFYAHANEYKQAPSIQIHVEGFQASIEAPQTNFYGKMKQDPADYTAEQEKRLNAQIEAQQKKALDKAKGKMVELHQAAIAAEVIKKENEKLKGEMKGLQSQVKDLTGKVAQLSKTIVHQSSQAAVLIEGIVLDKISKKELGQAILEVPAKEDKKQESIRSLLTGIGISVEEVPIEQKKEVKQMKEHKRGGGIGM
jgi:FtsZ-binding cell division protein ZapB